MNAIVADNDTCDLGGCDGFFYLSTGRLMLDLRLGMAAQLTHGFPDEKGGAVWSEGHGFR